MAWVDVGDLEEGMILGTDLLNAHGQMLLPAGVEITARHIELFRSQRIQEVDIRQPGTGENAEIDMETLEKAKKQVQGRFIRADLTHPMVAALFDICVDTLARSMIDENLDHEN